MIDKQGPHGKQQTPILQILLPPQSEILRNPPTTKRCDKTMYNLFPKIEESADFRSFVQTERASLIVQLLYVCRSPCCLICFDTFLT